MTEEKTVAITIYRPQKIFSGLIAYPRNGHNTDLARVFWLAVVQKYSPHVVRALSVNAAISYANLYSEVTKVL